MPKPTTNYQLPTTKSNLKVALVCDWLVSIGGAERVVLELHKMFPSAPIYTSQYDPQGLTWFKDADVRTLWLQKLPKGLRKFLPVFRAWSFSRLDLSGYDLVISASGAEAKGVRTKPKKHWWIRNVQSAAARGASENRKGDVHDSTLTADRSLQQSDVAESASGTFGSAKRQAGAVHISYCHSPTHYYWIRYDEYMKNPGFGPFNWLARIGLALLVKPLRRWDRRAAQRPNYMIANSSFTRANIKKYYGRSSTIIHPPVEVERFRPPTTNYQLPTTKLGFVTTGNQRPYMRRDIAVKACSRLDLPLTVIGNGPEHNKLVGMAGSSIRFLTDVSDGDMPKHIQSAEAFIFPAKEDFGIAAVEALAAGTPVIAFRGGGALDYIKPGKNGVFFEKQTVKSLCDVLQNFRSQNFDNNVVSSSAKQFDKNKFRENIQEFLGKAVNKDSAAKH